MRLHKLEVKTQELADALATGLALRIMDHGIEADQAAVRGAAPKAGDERGRIHPGGQVQFMAQVHQHQVVLLFMLRHEGKCVRLHQFQVLQPVHVEVGPGQTLHFRIPVHPGDRGFQAHFTAKDAGGTACTEAKNEHGSGVPLMDRLVVEALLPYGMEVPIALVGMAAVHHQMPTFIHQAQGPVFPRAFPNSDRPSIAQQALHPPHGAKMRPLYVAYLRRSRSILKRISAITRYKLRKLLKYALVTASIGTVLTLFGGTLDRNVLLGWVFLGTWTGILEEFLFGRRFRSLAIPLQFIGKALAVNLFTIVLLGIALLASQGHAVAPANGLWNSFSEMVASIGIYRFALQVMVVTSLAILVVQVEEFMGRRFFMGFLLGWYDKPREAERVVLSIDLVGSSALNERLGDLLYFRFLNTTHSLMTDAVLRHDAEIHKYVGDEVIFTWTMRTGIHHYNCLGLFFDIKERIEAHRDVMMREFGVAPEFRGGLHGGRVITAQVGHIKRAIDLSGDVMNTTSRVQAMAKNQKADLMITQDLLDRMPGAEQFYVFGEALPLRVKGGKRQMIIREVQRAQTAAITGKA